MENLIAFMNEFLSYILLLVIIVIVAALGFFVGRFFGKSKEAKKALEIENNEA
jgi:predicted Na+-dependent transporter